MGCCRLVTSNLTLSGPPDDRAYVSIICLMKLGWLMLYFVSSWELVLSCQTFLVLSAIQAFYNDLELPAQCLWCYC